MLHGENRRTYGSLTNDCHIGAMVERRLLNLENFASRTIPSVQNQIYVKGRYELLKYSGPSKVEHNPFQEAVRLSICSTFELNFPMRNNVN
jgi:hypothetical protein